MVLSKFLSPALLLTATIAVTTQQHAPLPNSQNPLLLGLSPTPETQEPIPLTIVGKVKFSELLNSLLNVLRFEQIPHWVKYDFRLA
jgi:hypothetical protein